MLICGCSNGRLRCSDASAPAQTGAVAGYTLEISSAFHAGGRPMSASGNHQQTNGNGAHAIGQGLHRPGAARAVDCEAPRGGRAQRRQQHEPDALCAQRDDHRRDGVCGAGGEGGAGVCARRDCGGADDYPGQYQPPGAGADGDRRGIAVQDQRQHRQLGDGVERGRGAAQAAHGRPLRGGHGDGPVDRRRHSHDPRADPAPLAGADWARCRSTRRWRG